MNFFRTKQKTEPVIAKSTFEMVDDAVIRLSSDINNLSAMRDDTLSSFRAIANNLNGINEQLKDKADTLDRLINFATDEKGVAQKLMSDNDSVRKKLLDIIGE